MTVYRLEDIAKALHRPSNAMRPLLEARFKVYQLGTTVFVAVPRPMQQKGA